MSVRVFHAPGEGLRPGVRLELDREEAHYLFRVRRARAGDIVELLDGAGGRWQATVESRSDDGHAAVTLGAVVETLQPAREIILLLAAPEPKATLDALAAACAGGAAGVLLVATERSQAAQPNAERIERVMRATMRQCGRPTAPALRGPVSLDEALAERTQFPGVVARPAAEPGPPPGGPGLRLLVGPEGGLSGDEHRRISAAGFASLSLGPWTLRTEAAVTAGLCRLITG